MKYHNVFEQKEINYRIQVCHNIDKKKSKKEIKKDLVETKKAYKNLYSSDIIDNKKDTTEKENLDIKPNISNSNIIKINLTSLEFEQF